MKELTRQQIIEETIQYYLVDQNPRGYNSYECVYLGDKGEKCAVGRCLVDPTLLHGYIGNIFDMVRDNFEGEQRKFDLFLKPQYRGQSIRFWQELQVFHDIHMDTNPNGKNVLNEWEKGNISKQISEDTFELINKALNITTIINLEDCVKRE